VITDSLTDRRPVLTNYNLRSHNDNFGLFHTGRNSRGGLIFGGGQGQVSQSYDAKTGRTIVHDTPELLRRANIRQRGIEMYEQARRDEVKRTTAVAKDFDARNIESFRQKNASDITDLKLNKPALRSLEINANANLGKDIIIQRKLLKDINNANLGLVKDSDGVLLPNVENIEKLIGVEEKGNVGTGSAYIKRINYPITSELITTKQALCKTPEEKNKVFFDEIYNIRRTIVNAHEKLRNDNFTEEDYRNISRFGFFTGKSATDDRIDLLSKGKKKLTLFYKEFYSNDVIKPDAEISYDKKIVGIRPGEKFIPDKINNIPSPNVFAATPAASIGIINTNNNEFGSKIQNKIGIENDGFVDSSKVSYNDPSYRYIDSFQRRQAAKIINGEPIDFKTQTLDYRTHMINKHPEGT
jgi:hypothetical protein